MTPIYSSLYNPDIVDTCESKTGPKPKYQEDFARQAYVACKEGGFTDIKLAALFNVSKSLINNWKKDHPKFYDALKRGKDEYDCEKVETSLLKRAKGFRYTETTRELQQVLSQPDPVYVQPKDGSALTSYQPESVATSEMVVTKTVSKVHSPDTKAAEFWLCNRNPDRWKKLKHVELTGKGGSNLMGAEPVTAFMTMLEKLAGPEYVEKFKADLAKYDASNSQL